MVAVSPPPRGSPSSRGRSPASAANSPPTTLLKKAQDNSGASVRAASPAPSRSRASPPPSSYHRDSRARSPDYAWDRSSRPYPPPMRGRSRSHTPIDLSPSPPPMPARMHRRSRSRSFDDYPSYRDDGPPPRFGRGRGRGRGGRGGGYNGPGPGPGQPRACKVRLTSTYLQTVSDTVVPMTHSSASSVITQLASTGTRPETVQRLHPKE